MDLVFILDQLYTLLFYPKNISTDNKMSRIVQISCSCSIPFLVVFAIEDFGFSFTLPILVLVAAGIIILIARVIRTKRTRYYLTSARILETRGGRIIKEIPLHHFAGKPISQFLETRVSHMSNNRPVYGIRIYDPMSDDVLEIKGQSVSSTRAFERIGDVLECPYCHFDNTALSSKCLNCGAVL